MDKPRIDAASGRVAPGCVLTLRFDSREFYIQLDKAEAAELANLMERYKSQ